MSALHITNGDSAGDKLRRIVTGTVTITADPLHEGPAPRVDGDEWYDVRGRFLANGDTTHEEVKNTLASWDRAIAEGRHAGDIVLWFEHDLFDQLLLIRTLDLIGGPPKLQRRRKLYAEAGWTALHSNVSLICIGAFPDIEPFVGLGQLSEEQLATLIGTERPVTSEQYALAAEAWEAFRSPDPRALFEITVRLRAPRTSAGKPDTTYGDELPFLRDALLRFFAEFPSEASGLSRTEELALRALRDGGMTGGALFVAVQALEPRPFMGDSTFFGILRTLASARVPLVTISGSPEEPDLRSHVIAITDAAREVLAGRADHIALNGIDLWRGGVHLAGRDTSPWRWDARSETLVS